MTYDAAVITDQPQNYWRLNEGPGAAAVLDYGNQPGMLWATSVVSAGNAFFGFSGAGFSGITASGGSYQVGPNGFSNQVTTGAGSSNPYTPLPEPGTLECWFFSEQMNALAYVGWHAPSAPTNQQLWGLELNEGSVTFRLLTFSNVQVALGTKGIWHHVAMAWTGGAVLTYIDGIATQVGFYTGSVGGGHVDFLVGDNHLPPFQLATAGLVTEVATYRRALTQAQLQTHIAQAELAQTRPHWLGQRSTASSSSVTIRRDYTMGARHLSLTGAGSFVIPFGLRGVQVDIVDPFPPGRVSPGTPPYLWDVGWLSLLDPNGLVAEIRPNRDTRVWQPDGAELCNVVAYNLNPGWIIDVTELDPA